MDNNYCKQNSTFQEWWDEFKRRCEVTGVVINLEDRTLYQENYYDQHYTVNEAIFEEIESSEE